MSDNIVSINSRFQQAKRFFVLNKIRGESSLSSCVKLMMYILNRVFLSNKEMLNKGDVFYGFQLYSLPLLISYSRSGTNWIRYIIEFLSQQPTPGYTRSKAGYNFIIDRAHAGYNSIEKYGKAILVIRNYKECLVRHHGAEYVNSFESIADFLQSDDRFQKPEWYIKNIAAFDDFKGEKMVLYYEDLLTDTIEQVTKIAEFLDLDKSRLTTLISNIPEHKKKSVELYKVDHDSVTAGDEHKLDYHSKKALPEEDHLAFDKYYRENYPDLFKRYLSRYEAGG